MDKSLIHIAAKDPKTWTSDDRPRIYVPDSLPYLFEYYSNAAQDDQHSGLEVCILPTKEVTPTYVKKLNARPGILALQMRRKSNSLEGLQFDVPGGRFNELYGWDAYFSALGLLDTGRVHIAKDIVMNHCFEIEHYGCILNANRTYYLGRSQPPFLTDLTLRVFARIRPEPDAEDFLRNAICAAIKEYHRVWMAHPRFDPDTGLSRYRPAGAGIPPEVEDTQYDHIILPRARLRNLSKAEFIDGFNEGTIIDHELDDYFLHDRAVRESGHDTS